VLGELGAGARDIDVGSGGGLPGIPLAIVMPGVQFVLLEPTGKKAAFLRHAAGQLALANVEVLRDRAESIAAAGSAGAGVHRNGYDAVVARAVGRLRTLAELTVPLAKVGGLVVLVKGRQADEELAEAKAALHALCVSHAGTIDTPTGRIVVLEKRRPTPARYPRSAAEIKKNPLGA
jgi:16S rRNA (guanine527-N7)-methyltransferase